MHNKLHECLLFLFISFLSSLLFGLAGNIISFMVYLAPVPTFYQVYKKKSTEGFQSIPYVVGLFSAMLWIYYALLKSNAMLLITINSVGCFIETIYVCFYLFYAPKKARIETVKLLLLLNGGGYALIIILTQFLAKEGTCFTIVGWICLVFSLGVFVAPLCVVIPNVLGFIFGVLQMVLYLMYKNTKKFIEQKLPVLKEQIIDVVELSAMVCAEIIPVVAKLCENGNDMVEVRDVPKKILEVRK
ncbi:hypothetical protein RJ640_014032 [Escallonia rubra]|uniref:Bidirectional sugar transporter SWEET n=1 Tax=Escallonia rubra TaxID=112253 RepID=A0AA88RL71_9ASTE|nr:hypothetical protein RJ640_014032 [Escallonia rubra]